MVPFSIISVQLFITKPSGAWSEVPNLTLSVVTKPDAAYFTAAFISVNKVSGTSLTPLDHYTKIER